MAIQKKHGKGRLDKWYKLAKEKGYRARAAFKLIQLNKKYGFLEKSKVLLDLCAAPGSWCQVAVETMPVDSIIVGVDLSPITPIPRVITFQSDITTEQCRATIRTHLKTWKADTVLHDGAPNVGTAWVQDSYNQALLTLQAMKLATDFLVEGGTFVTKVFRSKDYTSLLWVFNQLFTDVKSTKPPSSRNVSAEMFVVCRGYKAPKRIDPRFLDPKSVFEDLANPTPNNEAKVYKPELKKRKREGYEDGDYIQFKEVPVSEFVETTDPLAILGSCNKLSFDQKQNGDVAMSVLDKLPDTTSDIRAACDDLKVLGRKEFKMLLKWRLKVRDILGFPGKKTTKPTLEEEVTQVEDMDEELKIQEELQALKDKDDGRKKKERRKENEKKQKQVIRMQLNMAAPMDIGMEQQGPAGSDAMFALKSVDKVGSTKIVNGKMAMLNVNENKHRDSGIGSESEMSDEDGDDLEGDLDGMYEAFVERRAARDAKYRAKRARKEHDDDEWEGVSGEEDEKEDDDSDSDELMEDSDSDAGTPAVPQKSQKLIATLDSTEASSNGLTNRANRFFGRDVFQGIDGLDDVLGDVSEEEEGDQGGIASDSDDGIPTRKEQKAARSREKKGDASADSNGKIEVVQRESEKEWREERHLPDGRLDIDIITTEAMTLAHQLASGQKTSADAIDEGFNKLAFRDREGLPDWFLDDEGKHDKTQKPTTKAAARAIQEKLRALNARPIKKVREAKARKKFKAAQRLEKLRKKSDILASDEGMTEKEKADSIGKMLAKAARKKPRKEVKVVVAMGANRGVKGRPKGVKGRYKIVDKRMKKDMRGLKRAAAKSK